jgi:hypothetical protein
MEQVQHHLCLQAAMLPALRIMDWTSETVSQPQLNVFLYKSVGSQGVSSQQRNSDTAERYLCPSLRAAPACMCERAQGLARRLCWWEACHQAWKPEFRVQGTVEEWEPTPTDHPLIL